MCLPYSQPNTSLGCLAAPRQRRPHTSGPGLSRSAGPSRTGARRGQRGDKGAPALLRMVVRGGRESGGSTGGICPVCRVHPPGTPVGSRPVPGRKLRRARAESALSAVRSPHGPRAGPPPGPLPGRSQPSRQAPPARPDTSAVSSGAAAPAPSASTRATAAPGGGGALSRRPV